MTCVLYSCGSCSHSSWSRRVRQATQLPGHLFNMVWGWLHQLLCVPQGHPHKSVSEFQTHNPTVHKRTIIKTLMCKASWGPIFVRSKLGGGEKACRQGPPGEWVPTGIFQQAQFATQPEASRGMQCRPFPYSMGCQSPFIGCCWPSMSPSIYLGPYDQNWYTRGTLYQWTAGRAWSTAYHVPNASVHTLGRPADPLTHAHPQINLRQIACRSPGTSSSIRPPSTKGRAPCQNSTLHYWTTHITFGALGARSFQHVLF